MHNPIEIWKDCECDSDYQVSSIGNVRSKTREIKTGRNASHIRVKHGVLFKPCKLNTGYMQVMFKGRKKHAVHRLVAFAFCEGYLDGLVVNHKNGIRHDNRAENLEWVTHSSNLLHAYNVLKVKPSMLGRFSSDNNKSKAVISTCMKTGIEEYYGSAMDAVRIGFKSCAISRCCNKINSHHKGFYWRFADE